MRKTQVGEQGTIELVVPPQSGGERSEPERSGGTASPAAAARIPGSGGRVPDPEVAVKPLRRHHTAAYKLRILRETDTCGPGGIAALLRREGLYSSALDSVAAAARAWTNGWPGIREEGPQTGTSQPSGSRERAPAPGE